MRNFRYYGFWLMDALKGSVIKKAVREIALYDKMDCNNPKLQEYHKTALERLIKHATDTTEFYSEFKDYADIPVINKNCILSQQDMFLSSTFDEEKLFKMFTSGSTGTPFVCYQNAGKKRRVSAEIIYYSGKAGYSVGDVLVFLRAITKESQKNQLKQFIQNEKLVDISQLDDDKIERILRNLAKKKTRTMLLAYASTYDAFKDYLNRKHISLKKKGNICGIVSSSEMLFDETRNKMSEFFGCDCISRYSNQENGVIGQDENINNVFLINEADYIVEIYKMDKDEKAAAGEVGRIVITDLYNYAMPMIKYDTGDVGAIEIIENNGMKHRVISKFGGRKVDVIYDCLGNRLSPHIITNNMWKFSGIKQYQFIQKDKAAYVIKLNTEPEFIKTDEVVSTLKELVGENAQIQVEYVDEIPVMASGKRKYISCEYIPSKKNH